MEPQDYTLLVVDDNEMNRDMLSRRLRRKGYGVEVAEDGAKALELVAGQPVDLVLLDIMMPGIDGIQVLRELRQKHSQAELPVIMATAKADSADVVEALELGANDYVTKPLDFPVVLARVQAQLRTKAAAPPPRTGEPTAAELEPGAVVAGKYRLEEKIGAGNFGAVYRARHLDLDSDVALKLLLPSVTGSEESLKRFQLEGVAACRVRHPNAVQVSDAGVTDAGVAYLVMELLTGASLAAVLRTSGPKLPPQRCLEILGPVCDVLAEAHGAGLVHRDIKPENIFLHRTPRGEEVKVLDFGIAKLVGEAVARENLTTEGWILGTPAYVAPERISNQTYDGRADVYSLGIMLFEMLAGRRPFPVQDDPMAILMMHVQTEPWTLKSVAPELPDELGEVVARAIRKDPAARPGAGELKAALERAVGSVEVRSTAPTEAHPAPALAATRPAPAPADEDALPTVVVDGGGRLKRWLRKVRTGS